MLICVTILKTDETKLKLRVIMAEIGCLENRIGKTNLHNFILKTRVTFNTKAETTDYHILPNHHVKDYFFQM